MTAFTDREQSIEPASATEAEENPFPALTLGKLLKHTYPPREMLLEPWLPMRSLSMIHGPRGVGKTFLTLTIALAVASGQGFLGWTPGRKTRVLYIDGEVTCTELQQRSRQLLGDAPRDLPVDFMPRDHYDSWMPRLDSEQLKRAIENNINGEETLIVIDNLSTLWRGKENEADCWDDMQDWMGRQKQQGRSVLLVHHTNKRGDQRGSNRKEDNLDVVIGLRRPEVYDPKEGARFILEFTKCRSLYGEAADAFEARLVKNKASGLLEWQRESNQASDTCGRVVQLVLEGKRQSEIARILGKNKSTISRCVQHAVNEGMLPAEEGQ